MQPPDELNPYEGKPRAELRQAFHSHMEVCGPCSSNFDWCFRMIWICEAIASLTDQFFRRR